MLTVRNLSVPGIAPFDFDLAAGECAVLGGPSGSGKTLILRAIADLDPNDGAVALDDADRDAMPAPAWRRRVGYLAAEPGWWAETVGEHFVDGAPTALFEPLRLPSRLLDQPVAQASTGERQRLALCRALALDPAVLLLDEPTAALDDESAAGVETILRDRLAAGVALVLVTHDTDFADRMGRRRMRIVGGRVET